MASDRLSLVEALQMASAFYSNPIKKSVPEVYRRLFGRMFKRPTKPVRWGWKEPNTHIYLDELLAGIADLKYIYVIRNGIDMAFSRNLHQLKNWGWKFGIHVDQDEAQESLSAKQLEYWIRSNRRVIEIAAKYPDRCLLLKFSDFCNYPMQQIDRLLDFAGLVIDNTKKSALPDPRRFQILEEIYGKRLTFVPTRPTAGLAGMGVRYLNLMATNGPTLYGRSSDISSKKRLYVKLSG